ncbi:MAG: hypothetical protein ACE37M_11610 [Henriciella sp.]
MSRRIVTTKYISSLWSGSSICEQRQKTLLPFPGGVFVGYHGIAELPPYAELLPIEGAEELRAALERAIQEAKNLEQAGDVK